MLATPRIAGHRLAAPQVGNSNQGLGIADIPLTRAAENE
jgi:hypothetical protein